MQRLHFYIVFIFIAVIILSNSLYTVNQKQYAVAFQFGEAKEIVSDAGLHMKIPFIQQIEYFDKRVLSVHVEAKELTAVDGKRFVIDAFARFKIVNPVFFYKTVHNYQGIQLRLSKILESSMRKVIGTIPLSVLLSEERSKVMEKIEHLLKEESKFYGVDIIDVRILKTDLPKENSAAIYKRMQTEREKEAKQIRAEGNEMATKIRSEADKEVKILLAESYTKAQKIKAHGDNEAAKIYNASYSKDPEFYSFYKHLNTYKHSFKKEDTKFVISADSKLLKYLDITPNSGKYVNKNVNKNF